MLAAGAIGGRAATFDAENGDIHHSFRAHTFGLTSLAWRPTPRNSVTAGQDGKARLWKAKNYCEVACLKGGDQWVRHVVADGKELATVAVESCVSGAATEPSFVRAQSTQHYQR